jgi:hypothetical protein
MNIPGGESIIGLCKVVRTEEDTEAAKAQPEEEEPAPDGNASVSPAL